MAEDEAEDCGVKRGAMTRYVFEEVRYPASKNVPCVACGKKVRRSTTFTATINPWNLNERGEQASYVEVREKLRQEATGWLTEPAECMPCMRVRMRAR